jgi:hypothetical protein
MQAAAYSSEPKITVGGGHFRRQHHGGPRSAFRREASEGAGAVEYEFVTICIMSHGDKEPGKLLGRFEVEQFFGNEARPIRFRGALNVTDYLAYIATIRRAKVMALRPFGSLLR